MQPRGQDIGQGAKHTRTQAGAQRDMSEVGDVRRGRPSRGERRTKCWAPRTGFLAGAVPPSPTKLLHLPGLDKDFQKQSEAGRI